MADITITAASVVAGTGSVRKAGIAGETITAGQAIYLSSTTQKWMLADNNSAEAEPRTAIGIALNGAALNQPTVALTSGDVTIGATLTAGAAYYLSDTAGGICPLADVLSGEYVCLIGLAKTTAILDVDIQFPNVVIT
jgi:hypothetical protein